MRARQLHKGNRTCWQLPQCRVDGLLAFTHAPKFRSFAGEVSSGGCSCEMKRSVGVFWCVTLRALLLSQMLFERPVLP